MKKKGFTLVELMVAVAIMAIITGIVFFNYNQFNESSLLNAFAYDLSLTIRQAQVYGLATRQGGGSQGDPITVASVTGDISSGNFQSAYGVHFDSSATNGTIPLILFADTPSPDGKGNWTGDGKYTPPTAGGNDVLLQSYTFQRGIKIVQLCANACTTDPADPSSPTTLDITFKRPDPEAFILTPFSSNGSGVYGASSAQIILQDGDNTAIRKTVTVYSTGQISVQ